MMTRQPALLAIVGLLLAGCSADHPLNPSFPITMAQARAEWASMCADPKPLARPVIVLGGIYDPGIVAGSVASEIRKITSDDDRILHLSFMIDGSFDHCARRLIEAVEKRFPCGDHGQTVEVDVVGFSMGGLVARHAASDGGAAAAGKRLRIARLFTIGTPHQGATLAAIPTIDKRVIDMRSGSAFLNALNQPQPPYELYPYVRLHDWVVGAANAAPPGRTPWWLGRGFSAHGFAGFDRRILADIARRLRGEAPYSLEPAAPLP